ncbi:MAG: MFS transporter [Thermomicrobiales bacterium]|nr:MFS transporter [Thermomicrobiales bacterium]
MRISFATSAAMIRRQFGFSRDVRLFLLYNLFANVGWGVFVLIFNLYLRELGLREDDMGMFNAAQTLAMAGGAATMGPVLDKLGIWGATVGGVAIFLVASLIMAFAEAPAALLLLSVVSGLGLAYLFTTTMPFIIAWTKRSERQFVSALSFSVVSLSTTLGSLVGGFLPDLLPGDDLHVYRWTLVAGTAIAALGLIPMFLMGQARSGRELPDPTAAREATDASERSQVRRDTAVFVLVGGLMAVGAGMVFPFYNVYLTDLGASSNQVGFIFAVGGLSAAAIGLSAPLISQRLGSVYGVAAVRLSIVPFYLALVLMPTLPLAAITHIVRQTSISMAWPIDSTFISEVLPPKARSRVFGLRSAAWNLGYSAASLVAGFLIVRVGYAATFLDLIVFTAIAMAVFVGYYIRHPRVVSGEMRGAVPAWRRPPLTSELVDTL